MQNVRGDDFHYDRVADLFSQLDCFFFAVSQGCGGDRQTVSFEDVLGFNFGQGIATLSACCGNDLAGFRAVNVIRLVHAVVGSLQQFVLFAQGCEGFDSKIGGVVGGNTMFDEPFSGFFTAFATNERDCQGFARGTGFFLCVVNGFRDFLRVSDGGFTIEYHHAIHPGVGVRILDAFIVSCKTSTTSDVDRVLGGTKGRHVFLELFLDVLGSKFQRQTVFFSCVSCQNANTTAIGDDQEVVTFHGRLQGERQGGVEHVIQIFSLGDTSLLEGCFVDLGTTCQ